MSTDDYATLAEILSFCRQEYNLSGYFAFCELVHSVADVLSHDDSFDRGRFVAACGA